MDEGSVACIEALIDGERKAIPLAANMVCSIGRDSQSTIVINHHLVSRNHAMIHCAAGGDFLVSDLGSRNGTFVNGHNAKGAVHLRDGDQIRIGEATMVFRACAAIPDAGEHTEGDTTAGAWSQDLITVLVIDIRDYTGMSRRLGEAAVAKVMNAFNREARAIFRRRGCWSMKFIGDAVMGVWLHQPGASKKTEVLAALQSLLEMEHMASGLPARLELDEPLRIGAGLNTGMAALGNVGSNTTADFTAMGDAVNKAFRLESATKELGSDLVLGPMTFRLLAPVAGIKGLFIPQDVTLKGYENPERVYALAGPLEPLVVHLTQKACESESSEGCRSIPPTAS